MTQNYNIIMHLESEISDFNRLKNFKKDAI